MEVMRSNELEAVQKGVNLLRKIGYVLTALVCPLRGGDSVAGDRRRTTLRSVGFSFIFVGVVVLFSRGAAANLVVDSLSEAASSDAAVTPYMTSVRRVWRRPSRSSPTGS